MRAGDAAVPVGWAATPERGNAQVLRLMVWILRRFGYDAGYALLYPITAYFLATSPAQRRNTRAFLRRALGRAPGWRDLFATYFAFAACLMDRVYLAARRTEAFDIELIGLEDLQAAMAGGQGCLLLGAHLGSFEAMRVIADRGCPVEVAVMMHEDNAARVKELFDAIGGEERSAAVIPLGRAESMLRVHELLERQGLVGVLADRIFRGERVLPVPFLGTPAPMAVGPHMLAVMLGVPVLLTFGLWKGKRRYQVRFEPFMPAQRTPRAGRDAAVAAMVAAYAARLEEVACENPTNWFNFHDFWTEFDE